MAWTVLLHDDFAPEFDELSEDVQDELLALMIALEGLGPRLGRPDADTLDGSKFKNMKELRFSIGRVRWRFAYAFDPARRGIVLCGGGKSGQSQALFYRSLIAKADKRFRALLDGERNAQPFRDPEEPAGGAQGEDRS